MTLGNQVRKLQPDMPFRYADLYTVVSLGDDPRMVVVSDGNPGGEQAVPCMSSYRVRSVGDKVLVVQLSGGSWLCMGKVGVDQSPPASIAYGVGQPADGGWRSSITAYVRDNADGSVSIYLDTAGSVPLPATAASVGSRGWLANSAAASEFPRAGSVSDTQADWSGGWFYGSAITAACVGKTVARMTVRVARTTGGRNGPALLRLGLHNSTGVATALTNTWTTSVTLDRNGAATVDIPASQRSLLASGAVTGIGVWGTGPGEYAEFTTSADVTITFG